VSHAGGRRAGVGNDIRTTQTKAAVSELRSHYTRGCADSVARRARARTFAFFARDWTGDERTLPRVSPAQASLRDVNVHMVAISRTAPLRDLSALDEHTAAFDL
jgi:hypothetical protein